MGKRRIETGHVTVHQWTPEMMKKLKEVWDTGASARGCAKMLFTEFKIQFSRNAVLGKIHRMGLSRVPKGATAPGKAKPKPVVQAKPKPVVQAKPITKVKIAPAAHAPLVPPPPEKIWLPLAGVEPMRLVDARTAHCRWPVELQNTEKDHWCCGGKRMGVGPYCLTHYKIGAVPLEPKHQRSLHRVAQQARRETRPSYN